MILGIIQARMGSTRLKNKVLVDIDGKANLLRVYERLSMSKLLDKVVISTSLNKKDNLIEEFCKKNKIEFFRGDEEDLLDRLYRTCEYFKADHFVRVTGDCPLVDPKIVDELITFYLNSKDKLDYASNNLKPSYPHGFDVEIFNVFTFRNVWRELKDKKMRALAGAYIYTNPDKFRLGFIRYKRNLSKIRVTLDYQEDLELLKKIFNRFDGRMFYLKDVERLYDENPGLFDLNKNRKNHTQRWDIDKYLEGNEKSSDD